MRNWTTHARARRLPASSALIAAGVLAAAAGPAVAGTHATASSGSANTVVAHQAGSSLPGRIGAGPRPGPAVLYRSPATAPQLTNRGVWHASPVLVSGAQAYRRGEFLYQDFLDDDHGARLTSDPNDPAAAGDLFSHPNGTLTYPTAPGYASNAADLVEFRVRPLKSTTAFRITLNTLKDPRLVAFSIGIGRGRLQPFPDGANVSAPASLFLTVHPAGGRVIAELQRAGTNRRLAGPAPTVRIDLRRRQIEVTVPHRTWNPRRSTVRMYLGVGLWDATRGSYLLPGTTASATTPGGAGTAAHPAAFFNVAFRLHEPMPSPTDGLSVVTNAAWWRDRQQGTALAANDISSLHADISFAKLLRGASDDSGVPRTGALDRIMASHYETSQGEDFSAGCGLQGSSKPSSCKPEYLQRLQPYAIYVPKSPAAPGGYGLTLLLHSLSANYNQYSSARNQSQFGARQIPAIVITPEARGPDLFYEGMGAVDTFEVWNDVAHHYRLNPAHTDITGYSMGGFGTFKLGAQFPDLFARAQPTVGEEANTDVLASFRNLPVLMWNNSADELVGPEQYTPDGMGLANLGYRYELDVFEPCPATSGAASCSPLFPDHLELAVNDQFSPAAAFLGSAPVPANPPHVTYVLDGARDRPGLGISADHAYWISGLRLRSQSHTGPNGDPDGSIDVRSHGFGVGDPPASSLQAGAGSLTGGNLGPIAYTSFAKTWGPTPGEAVTDTLDLTATNIAAASIDPKRAKVDCGVKLNIASDGPIAVTLLGCNRTVRAG